MPPDFERLVELHAARIRRIASRYAGSDSVDDLVQEIWTRLWLSYRSFRGDAKIETWLYRVALNTAMTHLKGVIRERDVRADVAARSAAGESVPPERSHADLLSDFLNLLGDVDASILMMYLDGLTANEMSNVLGISSNAIEVRINRMKRRFSDTYVD